MREIPNVKGFFATDSGEIYNSKFVERNYYRNTDGYKTCSVKHNTKGWVTYGVHRLVASCYLNLDLDDLSTQVNHLNLNKEDNRCLNLECVTGLENNIHSELFSSPDEPKLNIIKNGFIAKTVSLNELKTLYSKDLIETWRMIKKGFTPDNCVIKYRKSGHAKLVNKIVRQDWSKVKIKVLNLDTGICETFESLKACADEHKTTASHVFSCISKRDKIRLFKNKFIIQSDFETHLDIDPDVLINIRKNLKRKITAVSNTGCKLCFESISELCRVLDLSRKTIFRCFKHSKNFKYGNWSFSSL
jgi:hypothetical protein